MIRWLLLLFLGAASFLYGESPSPPNILLILVDDLGREAIGAYGGESHPTPAIDSLADQGMRFDHFYVSPVCHPTRISLMTGRYLSNLGNPEWGTYPAGDLENQTLAWGLKEAGYSTAISGKWHLAKLQDEPDHPHRLGFDSYCLFGWHEGPRYWQPRIWQNGQLREDVADRFGPDVYLEFLKNFIRDNREGPFFAYYSMTLAHPVSNDLDPHPPHGPGGRYLSMAEMIIEVDQRVGSLLETLEELGLRKNTLVFFLTDNGTSTKNYIRHVGKELVREAPTRSLWRGHWILGGKKTLTDWGIRIPAIAAWPGKISPGTTSDTLIDVTDLLPTLWDLTGGHTPLEDLDGKSFAELLKGEPFSGREWIISQKRDIACVRTREWKLRANGALYDMRYDPAEQSPLFPERDSPMTAAIRKQLETVLAPIAARLIEDFD